MIIETFDIGDIVFYVEKNLWERSAVVRRNVEITDIRIDIKDSTPIISYCLIYENRTHHTAFHQDLFKTLKEATKYKEEFTGYHR